MKNNILLTDLFNESFNINEDGSTRNIELIDKSSKMKINVEIPDDDKIEQLYKIIVNDPPEELEQFIKDNKEVDLNTNINKFSKTNDKNMTPLSLAVWVSYVTHEMIDNIIYLISKGAQKSGYILDYVEELEHLRSIDDIKDWDEWDTIRDIFDVEKYLTDEEKEQEDQDIYWDTKLHLYMDER